MKLTIHSSSWRLIVVLLVTLLFTSYTNAQELTQEQFEALTEQRGTAPEALILADIGIYDAKIVTQNDTTLTIGFDITNNADASQGDIKYGIDVIKASTNGQTIVDTLVANETLTLATHETQSKTLTYTIPPFLSGEYEIWLISRTTGGMMLGLSSVGTTTFTQTAPALTLVPESCVVTVEGETETYTLYQGVDVAQDEVLSLSCTVMNQSTESVTVTPTFETHRRTMYGELITTATSSETVTLKGSEEKTIAFTIPKASTPQSYDVSVHLTSTNTQQPLSNKIVAHYVLRGGSATIQTVTLDRDVYGVGDTLSARFIWSPSADGFLDSRAGTGTEIGTTTLLMQVTDMDGASCTQPVTQLLNPAQMEYVVQTPVIAPCIAPRATFTLTDATGNTLDTRTIESPVPEVVTPVTPEPIEVPFWNMLTVAMLLAVISSLIILFVVIQMLRHARSTNDVSNTILKALIFTVITGASMFGGVGEVGAVVYYPPGGAFVVNANINKATYAPGETIVVTGSITSYACANGGPLTLGLQAGLNPGSIPGFWWEGVWYAADPYLFPLETLLPPKTTLISASFNGTVTKYGTGYLTAPTIPGTYNAYALWGDLAYTDLWGGSRFVIGTFTVTAPTPVACVGSWSDNGTCSVSGACGQTGTVQQTYTITTPASGGGTACPYANGETQWGSTACSTAICPILNSCTNETIDNCDVVADLSGIQVDGTCTLSGECTYTCNDGTWEENTNSCSIPQCSDGIDNDTPNDGYIDFAGGDPGCENASDNNESNIITPPVLSATNNIVDTSGGSAPVDLVWDTNNGNEALCTLTGGLLSTNPLDPTNTNVPIDNPNTGSTTVNISARTTYTLTCPNGTDTTTVEIVPVGVET